jgi:hypothetical protein
MNSIDQFVTKYDNLFQKYKDKNEIKEKTDCNEYNFLYILETDYEDEDEELIKIYKLGMTEKSMISRMNGYSNIRNIECFQCKNPLKKERLVKAFLKHKIKVKPILGKEYFKDCKNIIKFLYILLQYIDENDILIWYKYYHIRDEKYIILLDSIYSFYNEVLKDHTNIKLDNMVKLYDEEFIEEIKEEESLDEDEEENTTNEEYEEQCNNKSSSVYKCEYCNKEYSNYSNLKHHKKTAKFCLNIQQNPPELKCEYCDKSFSLKKYLKQHINHCKIYKIYTENESLKNKLNTNNSHIEKFEITNKTKLEETETKYKLKLEKLENEYKHKLDKKDFEIKLKLENKDEIIKLKDQIINKLEKEINEHKKEINEYKKIIMQKLNN